MTAILASDIVSFSSIMESDEEGTILEIRGLRTKTDQENGQGNAEVPALNLYSPHRKYPLAFLLRYKNQDTLCHRDLFTRDGTEGTKYDRTPTDRNP